MAKLLLKEKDFVEFISNDENFQELLEKANEEYRSSDRYYDEDCLYEIIDEKVAEVIFRNFCGSDIDRFYDEFLSHCRKYYGHFWTKADFGEWYLNEYLNIDTMISGDGIQEVYDHLIRHNLDYGQVAYSVLHLSNDEFKYLNGYVFRMIED